MNVSYSSVTRESTVSVSGTHGDLVSIYEKHVEQHGKAPSLKQLFKTAREASSSEHDRDVISWLETAVADRLNDDDTNDQPSTPPFSPDSKGHHHHSLLHHHSDNDNDNDNERKSAIFVSPVFFPSEDSFHKLVSTLDNAKTSLDICVFTITDDQIAKTIIRALDRGVKVRIISDNDKAEDLGSDVVRLARDYDVPTRVDNSPAHMHHKFVVIDDALVINGSYNWTKGARYDNREDLTLTNSPQAVRGFKDEFEKLWREFANEQLN
ncbi:hypothetical protein CPC16_003826 [Podila verticillata]|nr:hypothetical protein BGZ59_001274 [Podila verticillata]KAF9370256.1 hypothetical protein CPC16_003826 [Podila verticillata]KAI9242297.1 MAG: hypothetical protein BYD32DRAFT_403830 [Podila humilis]KFH72131.1 hypothetical protein MVEG_02424 [Podila verticillata NRRL 6337]